MIAIDMESNVIDVDDVCAQLNDTGVVIVDCRYDLMEPAAGYRAYLDGHIPGAAYAHLHDDLSGPPTTDHGRHPLPGPGRITDLFRALGVNNDSFVYVYDSSFGSIAARLWWMLRYMGHERVSVINGGWHAWQRAGHPEEAGERKVEPGHFRGRPNRELLVTLDQVNKAPRLVDCREPARYRGEKEPVDPVAGHIPGAVNFFWKRNLDEQGRFLPAKRVREQLQASQCGTPAEKVVYYCGSGVTACFNVLAGTYAGLPMSRLYVGSWSEWCSDPGRPVAVGED